MQFMERKELFFILGLCLVVFIVRLVLAFLVPNLTYESYFHVRQVEHIRETGLPLFEDDLSYGGRIHRFLPFFHYFMAFFTLFLPLDLVTKILPNLLLAMLPFIVYLIAKEITTNKLAPFYSAFITGFLPILYTPNAFTIETLFLPLLFFLNLIKRFAVYAQGCRRSRFQSLQPDLNAAALAVAIFVGVDLV